MSRDHYRMGQRRRRIPQTLIAVIIGGLLTSIGSYFTSQSRAKADLAIAVHKDKQEAYAEYLGAVWQTKLSVSKDIEPSPELQDRVAISLMRVELLGGEAIRKQAHTLHDQSLSRGSSFFHVTKDSFLLLVRQDLTKD